MKNLSLSELVEELRKLSTVIVAAHISPDADAVGSSVGLAKGLIALGCNAKVYLHDLVPSRLKVFAEGVEILHQIPNEKFDAAIIVDTASKKRVGKDVEAFLSLGKQTFNIDHHVSNDGWAENNHIQASAAASAVIVFKILENLKLTLTPEIANLLYAGLLDDTGRFCFSNTNAEALEVASELVRAGALPSFVSKQLYGSMPLKLLQLKAHAISKLKFYHNNRIATLSVLEQELGQYAAKPEDTDGLVELVRSIEGVEVAVFQREISDGWKFSLRSKDDNIDLNVIAGYFGGGGHKAAAGCKLVGSAEETEEKVLEKIIAALN